MNDTVNLPQPAFRAHYDASQFRADSWADLKRLTARFADGDGRARANSQSDARAIGQALDQLECIEHYWAFPGPRTCRQLRRLLHQGRQRALAQQVSRVVRLLVSDAYRGSEAREAFGSDTDEADLAEGRPVKPNGRHYFEVLVVDDISVEEEQELQKRLLDMRRADDELLYDIVVVKTFEDALIALLFNHNLETAVLRYSFPYASETGLDELRHYLDVVDPALLADLSGTDQTIALGRVMRSLRPEVDLFLVTDDPIESIAGHQAMGFRRVFYRQEDYLELHLSILKGIRERYETPFFTAVREHSQKPTGVFHALPISRGKSITKSHWIQDMGQFYGPNIFLAETSATSGGLDSLLQPHGPLKKAQEKVARAFGAKKSFFVTNGTSTANKIVMQALVRPGDIVLVSRDCHKSHHYALVLSGAYPVYLDPYPLGEYSLYGAVPLDTIKRKLLLLKREGRLEKVRMVLLTNCTFDGIIYHPERVMRELLSIHPGLIFLWDEAWFGFAHFAPSYRKRTAMEATRVLLEQLKSPGYADKYAAYRTEHDKLDPDADATWLEGEHWPDPDKVRMRVYATQSTHKTLTALRQGSMIHVHDQDFERKVSDIFQEAYMTHTSTSPNYQILASLDVGRRQVELEGYELVKKSVELSMALRERIEESPRLRKYFRVLKVKDLVPKAYRPSGLEEMYSPDRGFGRMEEAFRDDELTLDPTRLTLHIGLSGIDGDSFKNRLMDEHDIQINKTSRNTVLFMLNIGTTRGGVAYLLEVLEQIAAALDEQLADQQDVEIARQQAAVDSLTKDLPPLPNFSRFHRAFAPSPTTPEGDLRKAFFLSYDDACCRYLPMDGSIAQEIESGRDVVSASFVTPYPPGFPVLVPGQTISADILAYLKALDVKEIHGYRADHGFRVFTQAALGEAELPKTPRPLRVEGADQLRPSNGGAL